MKSKHVLLAELQLNDPTLNREMFEMQVPSLVHKFNVSHMTVLSMKWHFQD